MRSRPVTVTLQRNRLRSKMAVEDMVWLIFEILLWTDQVASDASVDEGSVRTDLKGVRKQSSLF
jgi:hypothetical protein